MVDRDHWDWSGETGPRGNLREAVALFDNEKDLQAAVEDLECHGFSNAAMSRPVAPDQIEAALDQKISHMSDLEDDAAVPREAYVEPGAVQERATVTLLLPVYLAVLAAAGVAAAHSLEVWQTVVLSFLIGGIGMLVGGFYAVRIMRRHSARSQREQSLGGLLLWVRTGSQLQEQKAMNILRRSAARDVHLHGPAPTLAI